MALKGIRDDLKKSAQAAYEQAQNAYQQIDQVLLNFQHSSLMPEIRKRLLEVTQVADEGGMMLARLGQSILDRAENVRGSLLKNWQKDGNQTDLSPDFSSVVSPEVPVGPMAKTRKKKTSAAVSKKRPAKKTVKKRKTSITH